MTADLVDSEDVDQLRHEILRLRDQTIGAEAQVQYLRLRVTELEGQVAERDVRIEEWTDRVLERDKRIAILEAEILRLGKNFVRRLFRWLFRRLRRGERQNA